MIWPLADPEAPAESGDFWSQILDWFGEAGPKAIHVLSIVVVSLIIAWVLRFVIRRIVRRIVVGAKFKANVTDTQALDHSPLASVRVVQRTRTLGTILQGIVNVTVFVTALVLIVHALNPQVLASLTILTAAIGAGLGFGAQNIVRDVLNGLFIVAGDQLGIGDVVDLGLATGIVEHVSVRVTHVRDVNGTLWYVRNGEILRIGNMSMGWSRVIVDLSIPLDADIDAVEDKMLDVATDLMKDPKWRSRIIERPEMWGLESIGAEAQVVRVVMRTRSNAKDDVSQELRIRLKKAMDEMDVVVPTLESVTLEGTSGAQRVRGANPPKTKPTPLAPILAKKIRPVWRPRKPSSGDDAQAKSHEPPAITQPSASPPKSPKNPKPAQPRAERHDPPEDGTP